MKNYLLESECIKWNVYYFRMPVQLMTPGLWWNHPKRGNRGQVCNNKHETKIIMIDNWHTLKVPTRSTLLPNTITIATTIISISLTTTSELNSHYQQ